MRSFTFLALSSLLAGFVACSDDDGTNVTPNPPPGSGGAGAGGAGDAGPAGRGGSAAGTAGAAGSSAGSGGAGGSAGCTPVAQPDAGLDAGSPDAGSTDAGLDASAEGPPSVVSFERDVHPIFAQSCGPCHVTTGEGSHNVGGPDLAVAYDDAVGIGQRLVARVNGGGMPPSYADPPNDCGAQGRGDQPGDPGCLTVAEVELIQTWIDQCYPR